jgi:hypothetical protein
MPMEYNPRALADVWQLPPGAFLEGQRMLPMMQARDETAYQKSMPSSLQNVLKVLWGSSAKKM